MTISKRTRFEVLRRDRHTCRYCGATAPATRLDIDHVLPTALGGTDEPSNLVTACTACNQGKTSTSLDDQMVADIDQDALRWAAARQRAITRHRTQQQASREQFEQFFAVWQRVDPSLTHLPADADTSIAKWQTDGLDIQEIISAAWIAWQRPVPPSQKFRYLAGICRNKIADIDALTAEELENEQS